MIHQGQISNQIAQHLDDDMPKQMIHTEGEKKNTKVTAARTVAAAVRVTNTQLPLQKSNLMVFASSKNNIKQN